MFLFFFNKVNNYKFFAVKQAEKTTTITPTESTIEDQEINIGKLHNNS